MMDLQTHLSSCPKCMSSFQLVFVQCPDTEDCLVSRLYFHIMYFDAKFRITIIDNNKFMNALVLLDTQSVSARACTRTLIRPTKGLVDHHNCSLARYVHQCQGHEIAPDAAWL